jgi:phosphoglycolate phosphatase-like HAD superfamily hydrolase
MRVLALDFDGVICDSAREVFTAAVHTYGGIDPGSRVVQATLALRGSAASNLDLSSAPAFTAFRELMPLGNRAEDYGVALRAMDLGLALPDQAAYDGFYRSFDPSWLRRFHAAFYEVRDRLRADHLESWLALHAGYPPFPAFLERAAARCQPAVATARDAASLNVLLVHLGVAALIPQRSRLDKETGVHKTDHLTALARLLGVPFDQITFVDDKVNHLERVAPLGVRPVLAGWGHNTPREHARATALGFAVAQLDALDAVLLDGV